MATAAANAASLSAGESPQEPPLRRQRGRWRAWRKKAGTKAPADGEQGMQISEAAAAILVKYGVELGGVRVRCSADAAGPGYWKVPLCPQMPFRLVELRPRGPLCLTREFVVARFAELKDARLERIQYLQNEKVWRAFAELRRAGKCPRDGQPLIGGWRFHGTPSAYVPAICAEGFRTACDVSGGRTTLWSARRASVSHGYAMKQGADKHGLIYMFLCRVLYKQSADADWCTTVQLDAAMYPEFLISYRV